MSGAVMAVGSLDGVVRVADLTNLSALTIITTLAPVQALAPAEPSHCLLGTDKGLIAALSRFRTARPEFRDPRASAPARRPPACPKHAEHLQVAERHGLEAPRLCIKGVQATWG